MVGKSLNDTNLRGALIFILRQIYLIISNLRLKHIKPFVILAFILSKNSPCKKINDLAAGRTGDTAVSLSYISESIRRTGEYATDISELLINTLIND